MSDGKIGHSSLLHSKRLLLPLIVTTKKTTADLILGAAKSPILAR